MLALCQSSSVQLATVVDCTLIVVLLLYTDNLSQNLYFGTMFTSPILKCTIHCNLLTFDMKSSNSVDSLHTSYCLIHTTAQALQEERAVFCQGGVWCDVVVIRSPMGGPLLEP